MKSGAIFHVFRLKPREDLKESLMAYAKDNLIQAGAIVTCVGSLEQFNLRFANRTQGVLKKGYFEILSLSGTVSASRTHLHISLADHDGDTIGGHLLHDNLIYTTAEIVIAEISDLRFFPETDSQYGYQELGISPRES